MHSKKDVFRPSFLCSFKHALLQSLVFVVTGFSYFNRGRQVGVGERLLPIMAYTQVGGGGVLAKMVAFTDSGIKRILHHLEPGQGYKSKL